MKYQMGIYLVFSFTKRPYSRMTIWSDYFSLSTVYILTKDNMIDMPKNNVSRLLGLIPSSSIRIAVFHKDIAADIEIPKEIKTSSTLLL